jgi:hypothetical protein
MATHLLVQAARTLFPATSSLSIASQASTTDSATLAAVAPDEAAARAARAFSCCSAMARLTAVGRLPRNKERQKRGAQVLAIKCKRRWSHLQCTWTCATR